MTYCDGGTDFDDVIRHLRNKNIGVYPRRWSPMLKVLHRLHGEVTKLRWRALRKAGWQAVVSEQIVEAGLMLRHIRPEERRVLDFGGYESLLPLTLSALGHEVTVLDQRPYPFKAPRLTKRGRGPLRAEPPPPSPSIWCSRCQPSSTLDLAGMTTSRSPTVTG